MNYLSSSHIVDKDELEMNLRPILPPRLYSRSISLCLGTPRTKKRKVEVDYNSDTEIHAMLGVPSYHQRYQLYLHCNKVRKYVTLLLLLILACRPNFCNAAYNCCVYVGATPAISKQNLVQWLDNLAIAECGGQHCFVYRSITRTKIEGVYQMMVQHQHSAFESKLSLPLSLPLKGECL